MALAVSWRGPDRTSLDSMPHVSSVEVWDQPHFDRNPAAVYIRRLGSENSRRVMRDGLNTIATEALGLPTQIQVGPPTDSAAYAARRRRIAQENVTYLYCAWSFLRYPHRRSFVRWGRHYHHQADRWPFQCGNHRPI